MKKKISIYVIIILLSFFQCYIILTDNKGNDISVVNQEEYSSISTTKSVKNIKVIKEDLSKYNTLTILEYNKLEDQSWKIKCLLQGNREDVLKHLERINDYEIEDYSLNYEKNIVLIEANLIYK